MRRWILEAVILSLGLWLGGVSIKNGIYKFVEGNRTVTVKGLAEQEIAANKVTWPLMYKQVGDDLPTLYNKINSTNQTIVEFLKKKGVQESEITINAPEIIDLQADRYRSTQITHRYNVTAVITVTSNQVDLIRKLINEQGELLKQGIAITSDEYRYNVQYEFTALNEIKPMMIEEATRNARAAAEQFAEDSDSDLGKIKSAVQGQFTISDRDANTPYIKRVRVVTTVTYSLED